MPRYTKEEMEKLRRDGKRGGKLAAAKLTDEQRKERARNAAIARWSKRDAIPFDPTDSSPTDS